MNSRTVSTDSNTPVSTLGWDTAYVVPFSVVNKAIIAQKSYPTAFHYEDVTDIAISGIWTSWQLIPGGAGGNVQMVCLVESGTATGAGQHGDLAGSQIVIQVSLKQVAATDPLNDKTASGIGTAQNLVVNTRGKGLDPAVSVISSCYPNVDSVLLKDLLNSVFKNYFNAHISEFNHVFAVMNINEVADKNDFQWVKPTSFQYAVASPENGDIDKCAFGLIAMVQNHPISPDAQQTVDARALYDLPNGANSAFVISQEMVAHHLLLRGAVAVIQGSTSDDFDFGKDGIYVTNNKKLTWGNFQTKNGIISPTIEAHNFVLRAEDDNIYVEINNAEYEVSFGITAHMNMTQRFTYNTVRNSEGKYVFVPDIKGLGNPKITANVTLSNFLVNFQIVMSAIGLIAGIVCAASGFKAFDKLMSKVSVNVVTGEAANTAEISLSEEAFEEMLADDQEATEEESLAGAEATDAGAADADNVGQICGAVASSQFRLATGLVAAVAGGIAGYIPMAQMIANKDYNKIPAFDDFAAHCLKATAWPGLKEYTLIGARFRTSLVMALALDD
jgi:hypothetical protein